ncbi:hypothetical protein RBSH_02055 [Rhodopirellula baltica SH28]|uniref:Uncharacterized protein n=1 Tax=Rhodopirellula baltica SH28 TaxID=993517 RepID=K5DJK5_RHOBT|nr:hypothetical protein [Rhodopirellula baltica]EKK02623.1 hypothetical protein RBSH_02055 [Rhodopirellula baltica SH28]
MTRLAVLLASIFTASLAFAEQPASSTSEAQSDQRKIADVPATSNERYSAALHEYEVRLGEFEAGRSPVNVVLQSATRLLHTSLDAEISNSASLYDDRVANIESIARRNLQRGTCTVQEVAQAEWSRIDALLKRLLK